MIILRLAKNPLNRFLFSTGPTKQVGRTVVANLPNVQYPTKPKPQTEQERYSMNLLYETTNYLRKDKMPNCRYFAVQYNNRIYRFYNAYYYPLGRMIDRVATQIRGRTSPHYRNSVLNVKNGDICVIVNIEDPLLTGKKLLFKKLRYHTGFIGHLKQYSYKYVLNNKPQLLYHHLLKKTMPKNKLSMKYLDNLVLCRGPTHNLPQFPEFAPDKKIYSLLPQVNLLEIMQKDESLKIVQESQPGAAQKIIGRRPERFYTDREIEQMNRQKDEVIENLNKVHEDVPKYKTIPNITKQQYDVMKRKEKRIEDRYKVVRAPYKKSSYLKNENLKLYTSQRKARKDPHYQLMQNEELQEVDEENVADFPLVMGGAEQKKQ